MYLKQTKQKNGRITISITQAFRDEQGKTRNRTVKNFGYLDELVSTMGLDALEQCKDICKKMTEEAKLASAPVTLCIHPCQKIDKRTHNRKNIGCAVVLAFYNALGVEQTIRSVTRSSMIDFDANAVMRLLICERLFDPGSKQRAWRNKGNYFFKSDFSDDDVYRALDIFAKAKTSIIGAANRSIEKMGLRASLDTSFYDVTNYYFETDVIDDLHRKGMSKEHRPNPIVQMGLLQDKNAIPITYRLFPGNTNDCTTMLPILDELKDTYDLKHVVVVADKGLNTSLNIALNVAKHNGFIFSQSIRGTKSNKELRGWVLAEKGYEKRGEDDFKIKSRQDTKIIHLQGKDSADGKAKDVKVDVKVVAFWSRKYERRARQERADAIAKAHELVENPAAYTSATHFGAAKYVCGLNVDTKTGEILDAQHVLSFNEKRLADDEVCDGYYCIITSETDMLDDDIVDTYRGLWRIEESFKITKSCVEARPVYVRTPEHTEAHFLTCYLALCIIRLMQFTSRDSHSAQAMLDDLTRLCGSILEDGWWLFDHRSDLTDELFCLVGLEHPTRYMKLASIKKLLTKKGLTFKK